MPAPIEANADLGRAAEPATAPPAIEMIGIDKTFGAVRANRDVSLRIAKGSIHGIVGENGAGKSTLMSILYGFYEADRGEIRVMGRRRAIRNSADAIAAGIGMVHQHFMLVETFSVLENVVLGAEGGALLAGGLAKARGILNALAEEFDLSVPIEAKIADLPVGQQQRVEILKALYRHCEILILDEPTGVLTPQETEQLFRILVALKARGVTIILITHKLREIMAITDRVTVMRQGEIVAERETSATDAEELAELMVGRKLRRDRQKAEMPPGAALIRVEHVSLRDSSGIARLDDISFSVHAGEIVGIAGISGNGQSELLEVLSGMRAFSTGRIVIGERTIEAAHPSDPAAMRAMGLAHVPEDRLRSGLVKNFAAGESAILGYHRDGAFGSGWLLEPARLRAHCRDLMAAFDVRPPDPDLKSANFSGGNQQKLILAREMSRRPAMLLVGQPTRGVDIGAIELIHREILARREAGAAILLVSVELDEILALADRILVLFQGRIVGEMTSKTADEKTLGLMMANAWRPAA